MQKTKNKQKWVWPLPGCEMILHVKPHAGAFGAIRKWDIHSGQDIYCEPEQQVVAVEDGVVIAIEDFTGENSIPPSPWWNNTSSVLVEGASGVVVYGEIRPLETIKIGQHIKSTEVVGNVVTVLKKDKGLPMTMLHIELYKHGTNKTVVWLIGKPRPDELLNPTMKLLFLE